MKIMRYRGWGRLGIGFIAFLIAMALIFMPGRKSPYGVFLGTQTAIAQDDEGEEKAEDDDAEKGEAEEDSGKKEAPPPDPKIEFEGLEDKKKLIQEQEEQLRLEQERLDALKKEIEEKIEKLSGLNRQIEESLAKLKREETENERLKRVAEEKKMAQLVKVFSSMKPKKAGEIVNNMDLEVAKKMFLKMKGERAGQILSYVNSDRAAKISEKLTEKKGMFDE